MVDQLTLKNFKCFRDEKVPLGALTLLTGLNGSGKSTIFQAMLLMKQVEESIDEQIHLNGYWVELGRVSDVLSIFASDDNIFLELTSKNAGKLLLNFSSDSLSKTLGFDPDEFEETLEQLKKISYLSADRWGPRISLPMTTEQDAPEHVGKQGEYVAHFLAAYGDSKLKNDAIPNHPDKESRVLLQQVSAWMSEISPDVRVNATVVQSINASYSGFSFEAGKERTPDFKALHVGFGLSYTLPVVVALLAAEPGSILLIENPEAHLHPAGQTAMGRLISMVASSGAQVIVESHSDHILDGIRVAVKEGLIPPDETLCHYFFRNKKGESEFVSPKIDKTGRIDSWPDGFFDQSVLNLARLNAD